jgi:predicted nucleic acid-binding protein
MIVVDTNILINAHREDSPAVFQRMVEPLWAIPREKGTQDESERDFG